MSNIQENIERKDQVTLDYKTRPIKRKLQKITASSDVIHRFVVITSFKCEH